MHFAPPEKTDSAFDRKPVLSATTAAPPCSGAWAAPSLHAFRLLLTAAGLLLHALAGTVLGAGFACAAALRAHPSSGVSLPPSAPTRLQRFSVPSPVALAVVTGSVLRVYLTEAESELIQSSVLPGHRALRPLGHGTALRSSLQGWGDP